MRNYEAVVVVDPRLDQQSIQQAVERFTKAIGTRGEVTKLDTWGRRRLGYEINHLNEGHYVVAYFKAEPGLIAELDRLLEIGEQYVRAKIVRVP
ncbi:MAG: 30S ribosomal protein S6 [Actinomycetota bacterium]